MQLVVARAVQTAFDQDTKTENHCRTRVCAMTAPRTCFRTGTHDHRLRGLQGQSVPPAGLDRAYSGRVRWLGAVDEGGYRIRACRDPKRCGPQAGGAGHVKPWPRVLDTRHHGEEGDL